MVVEVRKRRELSDPEGVSILQSLTLKTVSGRCRLVIFPSYDDFF